MTYHDLPLLKPPVWTWEVPTYFFVGGAAGAASVIGAAAQLTGAGEEIVRDARWIAAAGSALSAPLLIADLGRPERFLNMLRVFKPQSPMSVGAWTVAAFGTASSAAAFAGLLRRRTSLPVTLIGNTSATVAAATGLVMATYTGVLIGATTIPVWNEHVQLLPVHFGASAMASAVSLLELRGHRHSALNALGIGAAVFETLSGAAIEAVPERHSAPLRHGRSGMLIRTGGVLSGPVPLVLRLFGKRKAAAASSLVGSLITRFAWVEAGKWSAADPRAALQPATQRVPESLSGSDLREGSAASANPAPPVSSDR
jgi:formate-dependent nitrite reductase membrane component NrfD